MEVTNIRLAGQNRELSLIVDKTVGQARFYFDACSTAYHCPVQFEPDSWNSIVVMFKMGLGPALGGVTYYVNGKKSECEWQHAPSSRTPLKSTVNYQGRFALGRSTQSSNYVPAYGLSRGEKLRNVGFAAGV